MSWKDLSELAPQLSTAELSFEKKKRLIGLFLGPSLFVLALLSSPLPHVTPTGMRTLAIFAWAVAWWMTEPVPLPVTALLTLPLFVLLGVLPLERALGYWAHWVVIFMLGAFIIGYAMEKYGLTRRVSLHLIASRLVAGSPWRLLVLFLSANTIVTGLISNTVVAVLFTSMGLGLLEILKAKPGSRYGLALFLGVAWASNIGATFTPSGTPTNLIAIALAQQAGYQIGYVQWFLGTAGFTVIQTIAMFVVLRMFLRKEDLQYHVPRESILEELRKLGPMSRGEKFATAAICMALTLWVLPEVSSMALGRAHPVAQLISARLNWGLAALMVGLSLFLMPLDWKNRKFVLSWGETVNNVEWGTMALIAGALAVGETVGNATLGLGEFFGYAVSLISGPETSRYVFLLGTVSLSVFLTNLATNTAIISFLGPIALSVAPIVGLNPVALIVVVSLSSCIGYSLPSSNPPCAIVFASGYVRIFSMAFRGSVLSAIGIILLSLIGYPIAEWVFSSTVVTVPSP